MSDRIDITPKVKDLTPEEAARLQQRLRDSTPVKKVLEESGPLHDCADQPPDSRDGNGVM